MAVHNVTVERTLATLLEGKRYSTIKDILVTMNGADIALVFSTLDEETLPLLFRLLPKELAAEAFAEMESDAQELLIRGFSDKELKDVVNELFVDDAADLVEEMPANVVNRILESADPEFRKAINDLLQYPEDSAGSIMTSEYVSLRENMTVADAIERIRRTGVDKETVYTCYVTESRKLQGIVPLRSILMCRDNETRISDIMDRNIITLNTLDSSEYAASQLSHYNFIALPVVDSDGHMVGIITFDDAMDVMRDEATADMEIMGGMTPSEKSYLRSNALELFLHRIPWLLLLMVSATFTGMIITNFESALAAQVALTAFIPMLMDTGGNSGSQASVTVIRALSLDELQFRDMPKVLWKELQTSLLCGSALAVVCFGKIYLIDKLLMGNADITVPVILVVCLTMLLTVMVAKLIGCALPMVAKKLGFDPAVMASPFITTIVDAVSLLVYFGFASLVLF